jgi:hypothetical protein
LHSEREHVILYITMRTIPIPLNPNQRRITLVALKRHSATLRERASNKKLHAHARAWAATDLQTVNAIVATLQLENPTRAYMRMMLER